MQRLLIFTTLVLLCFSSVQAQNDDKERPKMQEERRGTEPARVVRRRTREIAVKAPADFPKSDQPVFSGPQPGEQLSGFTAFELGGDGDQNKIDPIKKAGDDLHILFFMDNNGAGVRGLLGSANAIAKIQSKTDKKLQFSIVFLTDDVTALNTLGSRIAARLPPTTNLLVSHEGRDGPGTYGLNRNISMTVILAKGNKVVHNFVFPQSMLYPDPHVMGGIADLLKVERAVVKSWLDELSKPDASQMAKAGTQPPAAFRALLGEMVRAGTLTRDDAGKLYRAASSSGEEPQAMQGDKAKPSKTDGAKMKSDKYQNLAVVKDPAEFNSSGGERLYSGPQTGERLPALTVVGVGGKNDGKEFDPIQTAGDDPVLLALIDGSELGRKTTYFLGKLSEAVRANSSSNMQFSLVYFGDDPAVLEKQIEAVDNYLPDSLVSSYSKNGRDGPGNYGLNRKVPVTIILGKSGKVLHNFAFGQHVFEIDPHVAGAVAQAIGTERKTLANWLSKADKKYSANSGKMMKSEGAVGAWIAWGEKASGDEIEAALASEKFLSLPKESQIKIRKALQ